MFQMTYYCDLENRPTKQLAPGVTAKTYWGDKMLLSMVEFEPNAVVGNHSHPHEQTGVIMEGELTFVIGGQKRVCRPGDMYVIPGGVEHSATAVSGRVKALDVFSPVREEYKY
jgi:quercetin dioxygenase-like cupin family protein